MNWAARSLTNQRLFLRYAKGEIGKDEIIPRVEPSLNRAIDLARGEGLVLIESGKSLTLSSSGLATAEEISADKNCMVEEKRFLSAAKSFANEGNIDGLLTW